MIVGQSGSHEFIKDVILNFLKRFSLRFVVSSRIMVLMILIIPFRNKLLLYNQSLDPVTFL